MTVCMKSRQTIPHNYKTLAPVRSYYDTLWTTKLTFEFADI